jgi:endonuclease G, mitochondrial
MSNATFVLSNIIPQAPNLNQKAWNELEIYSRNLVSKKKNRRLYIVSGPLGVGGTGKNGSKKHLGTYNEITVPAECWKVMLVVDGTEDPKQDLKQANADSRVIAVLAPNDHDKVDSDWAKFRTSVAKIEEATGLKFFDRLSSEMRKALLEKVDETRIPKSAKSKKED